MRAPRGLSAEERAAWARLARTVEPLHPSPPPPPEDGHPRGGGPASPKPPPPLRRAAAKPSLPTAEDRPRPAARAIHDSGGLDFSWERKLKGAKIDPDFTLDLHGHSLDAAHDRLDRGLSQAKAMGARLVLVITGRQRPAEHADRGERRGAIRAKILDWLAAGQHQADIAAVRGAHRRHGGAGALYIVLRRGR